VKNHFSDAVVCLPLDPRVVGSNPANEPLSARNIRSTHSFEWKVEPEEAYLKILLHVKHHLESNNKIIINPSKE
jgi:hypothetical protein